MNCSGPALDLDNPFFTLLEIIGSMYSPHHGPVCLCICVWGVCANTLHLIVLYSSGMRHIAVNALLAAIALCDLGLMLDYLVYLLRYQMGIPLGQYWSWLVGIFHKSCDGTRGADNPVSHAWMCYLVFHACWSIALHTASLWISVAMAAFRYITLRKASTMGAGMWHKASTAWICSIALFICTSILVIPTLLVHQVVPLDDDKDKMIRQNESSALNKRELNVTENHNECLEVEEMSYTVEPPEFAVKDGCYIYKLNLWLTGVLFKALPCLLLLMFFAKLVGTLRETDRRRKALTSKHDRSPQIDRNPKLFDKSVSLHSRNTSDGTALQTFGTKCRSALKHGRGKALPRSKAERTNALLLTILLVFFITELPQGLLNVASAIYTNDVHNILYQQVGDLLDLFSLINSSLNFVIYACMSSKYRQSFSALFLPRKLKLCSTLNISLQTFSPLPKQELPMTQCANDAETDGNCHVAGAQQPQSDVQRVDAKWDTCVRDTKAVLNASDSNDIICVDEYHL